MANALLLNEITREDARSVASGAIALFPTGATEQHGPHLPTGTDSFAVERIARAAAEIAAEQVPVVVTPTLPFGSSHHHLPFGGTMSIGTETYYRVVFDLAESLIIGGFRRVFILNGHGGNHEIIQLVARDLALKHEARLASASYWNVAMEALIEADAPSFGRVPGHAGAFESSLALALRPDLVREPRPHRDEIPSAPRAASQPVRVEAHGWWQRTDGFSDSPDRGSADRGHAYLAAIAASVADALIAFSNASA